MEKAAQNLELILQYFSDFNPKQLEQLAALEGLYKDWNEKINVISRKDIDSLYEKHVLHSLAIAAAFELPKGSSVLDLGTGGGFPGIPLAIFFPEVQFRLVDSINKKLNVVRAISEAIGLQNLTTTHSRVEDIKDQKFDYVVSRAVAPLKDLWRWSKPLLRKNKVVFEARQSEESGHLVPAAGLICLKGGDLAQEINESAVKPAMMEIYDIFPLDFFKEKYLLHVTL